MTERSWLGKAMSLFGIVTVATASIAGGCGGDGPPSSSAVVADGGGRDVRTGAAPKPRLCENGESVDGPYPKAEYAFEIGQTLPDLTLDTTAAPIALRDFFEPCAQASRLLVLRVTAPWCGTCRWHAAHTKELLGLDIASRLALVDVLVADEDNVAAQPSDLAAWQSRVGVPIQAGVDPAARLVAVNPIRSPLPLYVLVDTRRMEVANFLNDPDPELLELRIRQELALLDGEPVPPSKESTKINGLFYRNHWDLLKEMTVPGAPPADPTNAKADDAAAAALGKKLFEEAALSPSGVTCKNCHDPTKAFADGLAQSTGVARVDRNAPSVLLASHARWQFWDGRADTLWMQALGPMENAKEMGSTRLFAAHAVRAMHRADYEAVWGAMPDLADTARFPASGKPGDASWSAMATSDQDAVTRVFVNVAKSIAAFERTLRVMPNRLDAYIAGDASALTELEKQGLFDYFVAGCAQCHYGPRLTNDAFHVVRFPTGRSDGAPDRGRVDGVTSLLGAEFNSVSKWSDAPSSARLAALANRSHPVGAFKTPTLRGTADTAPFGHGGSIPDIKELTIIYGKAGLEPEDGRALGVTEPWISKFSDHHRPGIEAILNVMAGKPAP